MTVLQSKFGKKRMKNEDFLKNIQNRPLGVTHKGGEIFPEIFFKYYKGPSVQISWPSDTRN